VISADEYVLQLALDKGLLHPDQITAAEAKVAAHDDVAVDTPTVLEMLHLQHVLAASAVARLLAAEFGMEVADLARSEGNLQLLKTVPRDLAVRYQVFPIEKTAARCASRSATHSTSMRSIASGTC
jgi:GSPII_E N-terminal domain.